MDQVNSLWEWLSSADNRDILKLIGSGIAALVTGFWVLFASSKTRRNTERNLNHSLDTETPVFKNSTAPPLPTLIIGRKNALRELKVRLGVADVGQAPMARHSLTVIRGWAGVGKTTIVAALAHDRAVQDIFYDGLLWTSLGQESNLLHELTSWGRALGIEDLHKENTPADASGRLRDVLSNKRMLLVVDDVWDLSDAQLFRVGGQHCTTLMTTRETKVAEALADTPQDIYKLDILSDESSFQLFQVLAPSVTANHPHEARTLIQVLEGLPLSLQVAGRLLNKEAARGFSVGDLLVELKEGMKLLEAQAPADRTDPVTGMIPSVVVLLEKSIDRLDLETRDCFAKLGPFAPKPATFDLMDLQAVWEVEDPKNTVNELVDHGLLEPLGAGRFQMHALLVMHANSLLKD